MNDIKDKFLKDCENSLKSAALSVNKGISEYQIKNCLSDAEKIYVVVISFLDHIDIEQVKDGEITYH